jgi:predicted homoserine dehydrogenase-like protein
MNLYRLLQRRADENRPLAVGLIGAGKFGSMYLAQAKHTPGIHVVGIADLAPARAKASLARTGWDDVECDPGNAAVAFRREMERAFG